MEQHTDNSQQTILSECDTETAVHSGAKRFIFPAVVQGEKYPIDCYYKNGYVYSVDNDKEVKLA